MQHWYLRMWFAPLFLSLGLTGLPACELPDLQSASFAEPGEFKQHNLPGGVIGVAMLDPMGDEGALLSGIPADAPPSERPAQGTAWLWSEASGWLLTPKSFEVRRAAVGVDGSWMIAMENPNPANNQRLLATSTGSCVGCAYSAGAAFFPDFAKQARENEFEFCRGLDQKVTVHQRAAQRLRLHYLSAGGLRHDAVVGTSDEQVQFNALTITGLPSELRAQVLAAFGVR